MATVLHVMCYGDSITEGPSGTNIRDGGAGNFIEQWSERLGDTSSARRIISPGFRSLWYSSALVLGSDGSAQATDEWTVDAVANWTHTSNTAAYNKAPQGQCWEGANGSTAIATWTRRFAARPVVGFDLLYIDYPSSGNWQYQIDGGTWTNMGQSNVQDNHLKKFYVASSVTSTVKVRQYNGSTSAGVCLVGIIPYSADPRSNDGMVFHNLGRFGYWLGVTTGIIDAATGADPLAFMDSVTLGTNAVAHTPILGTLEFVNDVAIYADAARWSTDLGKFWTRYTTNIQIPLVLFQMYESPGSTTLQGTYRTNSATFASGKNVTLINLFTAYQNLGFGGVGTQSTLLPNVLTGSDGVHPNAAGCYDIGQRLLDLTRTSLIPTPYTPTWDQTNPFVWGSSQFGGTNEFAGSQIANWTQSATATETQTSTIPRSVGKITSVVETQTASILRAIARLMSTVTETQTPTIVRSIARLMSTVTDTQTATLVRSVGRRMSTVTETATSSMILSAGKVFAFTETQTSTIDVLKAAVQELTAGHTQTASDILRTVGLTLQFTETGHATLVPVSSLGDIIAAGIRVIKILFKTEGRVLLEDEQRIEFESDQNVLFNNPRS